MKEQHKQIVEHAVENHIKNTIYKNSSIEMQVIAKGNFQEGIYEVLNNLEKYGLKSTEGYRTCHACGSSELKISLSKQYEQVSWNDKTANRERFLSNDTYYVINRVRTEHYVFTCKKCKYSFAERELTLLPK